MAQLIELDDLDDDCLMQVFDRMTPKELFKLQRLNQRMKRLAGIKMGVKIEAFKIKESFSHFSSCSHFYSISPDQVLVFEPTIDSYVSIPLILIVLSKCPSVRTIDFGRGLLDSDTLIEAYKRCPQLECIKLLVAPKTCDRVLDLIDQRVVHLAIEWIIESGLKSNYFLANVAAKCHNIKRIDWVNKHQSTSGLMPALKLLPKNCWVRLACFELTDDTFEDVVDELNSFTLNWSQLGHRYNRLSTLKFNIVEGPVHEVKFNGLKRLDFTESYITNSLLPINYLLASRFPLLEEFYFNASAGFTEEEPDYKAVFQRITTVKELRINCGKDLLMYKYPKLPQLTAINRLKNLETIYLVVLEIDDQWQPNDFLKQVEQYVDDIILLKKLTIDMRHRKNNVWDAAIEELVERMKRKQSKVNVVLVAN